MEKEKQEDATTASEEVSSIYCVLTWVRHALGNLSTFYLNLNNTSQSVKTVYSHVTNEKTRFRKTKEIYLKPTASKQDWNSELCSPMVQLKQHIEKNF